MSDNLIKMALGRAKNAQNTIDFELSKIEHHNLDKGSNKHNVLLSLFREITITVCFLEEELEKEAEE